MGAALDENARQAGEWTASPVQPSTDGAEAGPEHPGGLGESLATPSYEDWGAEPCEGNCVVELPRLGAGDGRGVTASGAASPGAPAARSRAGSSL